MLANGLEVIVVENHGVPLATVEIDVKNGSFTQTPEYAGLAHMYEHMFFKANAHLPEPDQFIDRAAELGAVFNGTTDEERVNYYLTLPADSLAGGMQVRSRTRSARRCSEGRARARAAGRDRRIRPQRVESVLQAAVGDRTSGSTRDSGAGRTSSATAT